MTKTRGIEWSKVNFEECKIKLKVIKWAAMWMYNNHGIQQRSGYTNKWADKLRNNEQE